MPALITYLLKCSLCLAITYLFYTLVLRRITFYNWNRWYLLSYSALSFLIPFIDPSLFIRRAHIDKAPAMTYIPVIASFSKYTQAAAALNNTFNFYTMLLAIFTGGVLLMLCRLLIQVLSFYRLKQKAIMISQDNTAIYQVDTDIIPFSFCNAIYLNKNLHTEKELKEIILHEYIHVKQGHTLDILLA
ncbi:MAG TPA: hypothetical protein VIJ27_14100, partial [Mucilaginibacter sp.]